MLQVGRTEALLQTGKELGVLSLASASATAGTRCLSLRSCAAASSVVAVAAAASKQSSPDLAVSPRLAVRRTALPRSSRRPIPARPRPPPPSQPQRAISRRGGEGDASRQRVLFLLGQRPAWCRSQPSQPRRAAALQPQNEPPSGMRAGRVSHYRWILFGRSDCCDCRATSKGPTAEDLVPTFMG